MRYNIATMGGEGAIKKASQKGGVSVIKFDKLHSLLKERGTTLYKLSAEKVIGSATRQKLLGQLPGGIDSKTINSLCCRLDCQPGDLMEYVPDNKEAGEL